MYRTYDEWKKSYEYNMDLLNETAETDIAFVPLSKLVKKLEDDYQAFNHYYWFDDKD